VAGGYSILYNEELHNLRVIKSKKMGRAGHLTCIREMGNAHKILGKNVKEDTS
jgi:hypothetical protein